MDENKYNLEVGDELVSKRGMIERINKISDYGALLGINTAEDRWEYINEQMIEDGGWTIKRKSIPEKWYVVRDAENAHVINSWYNGIKGGTTAYLDGTAYFYSDISYSFSANNQYKEITFEQFKKYILNENKMDKKIIGYKSAIDLFEGKYPKDTVWIKNPYKSDDGITAYRPDDGSNTYNAMPREIVETWEPIYENQSSTFSIGTPLKEVKINDKGEIEAEGHKIPKAFVEKLNKMFEPFKKEILSMTPTTAWIGCSEGTSINREDLEKVIYEFNKLNPNNKI